MELDCTRVSEHPRSVTYIEADRHYPKLGRNQFNASNRGGILPGRIPGHPEGRARKQLKKVATKSSFIRKREEVLTTALAGSGYLTDGFFRKLSCAAKSCGFAHAPHRPNGNPGSEGLIIR
jgi:hypothetical protein